tara:strand:+ start:548 stop:661 length:114 start_codon:yes stop_codon:yes gene_type:complete
MNSEKIAIFGGPRIDKKIKNIPKEKSNSRKLKKGGMI